MVFSTAKRRVWDKILRQSHVKQSEQHSVNIDRLSAEAFLQEAQAKSLADKKKKDNSGAARSAMQDSLSRPRSVFGQLFRALHPLHPRPPPGRLVCLGRRLRLGCCGGLASQRAATTDVHAYHACGCRRRDHLSSLRHAASPNLKIKRRLRPNVAAAAAATAGQSERDDRSLGRV